jgi:hypothetical protein
MKRQVVGRGGQTLLTLVSWHAFEKYVTTSMQVAPVTYNSFRTVFMQTESSVLSITRLLRDFTFRHGLQAKIATTFMIMTMAFILAFPTFASAMTGYSANVEPFVPDSEKNYLPFSTFQPLYYIIHDGDRIGKTKDYNVTDDNNDRKSFRLRIYYCDMR